MLQTGNKHINDHVHLDLTGSKGNICICIYIYTYMYSHYMCMYRLLKFALYKLCMLHAMT